MNEGRGVPLGGFVFVSATGLLTTWWAYKQGMIQFRDVRAWLACHELVAQRCGLEKGRTPRYRVEELGRIVGGGRGEHLRASVRRLERAELLTWSESSVRPLRTRVENAPDADDFVTQVTNHRRLIPVPRRLLRSLAADSRPVLVATALGHLLRCMYYRRGQCEPRGLCKASWIATVFEVDERNVKAARQELEKLEILIREPASQYRLNRWGLPIRFNLVWTGTGAERKAPPLVALSTTETPPPRETGNSSSGRSENQKPRIPAKSGVRKRTGRGPRLSRVLSIDIREPERLLVLFGEARRAGMVGESEADRLKFFAAAEHANVRGRKNPPGLFATLVRRGLWGYLTLEDEDRARQVLRAVPKEATRPIRCAPSWREGRASETPEQVRAMVAKSLGLAIDR
jgi:hypothetical protein